MGEDHRLTALLSETEAAGIKLRAQGGQLHITAPKTATHTARLVALAKAAVLARLGGRSLPDGACYRCGDQPDSLVPAYWGFPYCPACCQHLGDFGGELDAKAAWPQAGAEHPSMAARPVDAISPPTTPLPDTGG